MPPAERIRKTDAIIISHRDFGEADRLISAYTADYGKLTALAKGARRIQSRKAPHLEPITRTKLVLAKGNPFWIVTQAESENTFLTIRADLEKTAKTLYVLELTSRLTSDEQPDARIYRLITESLERIDGSELIANAVLFFELRMLDLAGFKPEFFECVNCKKGIQPQNQFFSASQGGVVCPQCADFGGGLIPASKETLRFLRHFQRSTYSQIAKIKITVTNWKLIYKIINPYISSVIERQLNSSVFLDRISHKAASEDDKGTINQNNGRL